MKDLHYLVELFAIKHDRKIKKICAPLHECLNIPIFTFFSIDADGSLAMISTCPEELNFYCKNRLYLDHPLMVHPSLLRSGSAFVRTVYDLEVANTVEERFHLRDAFIILRRRQNCMEGYIFANRAIGQAYNEIFLKNFDLLQRFICFFRREAEPLVRMIRGEGYNLKVAKGKKFWRPEPSLALSTANVLADKFSRQILPLSPRERECLELFQQGESAQSTAAILGLSQRTIESYFENIKNKLGCTSKSHLLNI